MRARPVALTISAALHLVLVLSLLPAPPGVAALPPSRPPVTMVVAAPEDDAYPGLNPVPAVEDAPHFKPGRTSLTFNDTKFDVSRIADRYQVLFPFLSPGLSLDLFALTPQDDFDRFLNGLRQRARHHQDARTVPLSLRPPALQALIDRTWSRRDRWQAMQPLLELADKYHPDAGDVPRMLRAYGEQNMGQYYEDRTRSVRDPRLWTELALAADHVDVISLVRGYASAHPSTRGTTELLFILDKVVEGNRNILATLQSTDPDEQLRDTRITAPDAYAVVLKIQRYYARILAERHLQTSADISAVYDGVRLKVLAGILSTTPQGYRASDAHFLSGSIQFRAGRLADALASWCGMVPGPDDVYSDVAARLLAVLRPTSGTAGRPCSTGSIPTVVSTTIETLLKQEDSRSWNFQYERLRQFGYAVDAF